VGLLHEEDWGIPLGSASKVGWVSPAVPARGRCTHGGAGAAVSAAGTGTCTGGVPQGSGH